MMPWRPVLSCGRVYETDPEAKELLDIANKIQGMPSHCGKHAAGVAISRDEPDQLYASVERSQRWQRYHPVR